MISAPPVYRFYYLHYSARSGNKRLFLRSQSQKRSYPEKWLPCILWPARFYGGGADSMSQTVKQENKTERANDQTNHWLFAYSSILTQL